MRNAPVESKSCGKIAGRCCLSLQSLPRILSYYIVILLFSIHVKRRTLQRRCRRRPVTGRGANELQYSFISFLSCRIYKILRDPVQILIVHMSSSLAIVCIINNNHVKKKKITDLPVT